MVGTAAHAEWHSDAVQDLGLDERCWQPLCGSDLTRLELVKMVNGWMPYPVAPELLAIDLAVASVECGDEVAAQRHLERPGVLAALATMVGQAMGTGDLSDQPTFRRSVTICALHRSDLTAIGPMACGLDPALISVFSDLRADGRILMRTHSAGIQTLLSTEVGRGSTGNLMGDAAPLTHIDSAPIDLGVVPPRVFSWLGPQWDELRLISTEGENAIQVRIEISAPDVTAGDYVVFLTAGDRKGETPLTRTTDGRALQATVVLGGRGAIPPASSLHVGIRHKDVSSQWAHSRLLTGEAESTRSLVEAWARLRLGSACLAVESVGREEPSSTWTSQSVQKVAMGARLALDARRKELIGSPTGLAAGAVGLLERNSALREESTRFVENATIWDAKPELTGTRRPLLAETLFVLGTLAPRPDAKIGVRTR